ncbi:putative serine protease 45 [Entomophthora muscae]|uniref:Serine protease 45 n=1 Tax=Entomophthora muscae TaxID=34485 RepID=A0ACC2SEU1_9FUNG|nr:putative serine protease 45 [Entomophthora muscae]
MAAAQFSHPLLGLKPTWKDYVDTRFMARLNYKGKQKCSGSMIYPIFLVTLASCISSTQMQDYTLSIGSFEVQVDKIHIHPMFGLIDGMDIAVLKTKPFPTSYTSISLETRFGESDTFLTGWKLLYPTNFTKLKVHSSRCLAYSEAYPFFPGTPLLKTHPKLIFVAFLAKYSFQSNTFSPITQIHHHQLWIEAIFHPAQ